MVAHPVVDRARPTGDARVLQAGDFNAAPPGFFRDTIIVVGTVDPAKTTFIDTPLGALPAVLVEANAVNTLLRNDFERPASPLFGWLAAVIGLVGVLLLPRTRWWLVALAALAASIAWLVVARAVADRGRLLPALLPVVAVLVAALLLGVAGQIEVVRERRRIRALFAQYVPRSVAEQLVASGRAGAASEGERVAVTTLFCDLRGFTPIAARLEPSQVRELLNTYYEQMAQVVLDEGGTVLQYTGDEIFGVFGTPLPQDDHARAALRCARRLSPPSSTSTTCSSSVRYQGSTSASGCTRATSWPRTWVRPPGCSTPSSATRSTSAAATARLLVKARSPCRR